MNPSPESIDKGLAQIKRLRRLFLFLLFSFVPLTMVTMAVAVRLHAWWLILVPLVLFCAGMVLQHRLQRSKCPQCQAFFFVQTVTKENYTPYSSFSFPPQKRCQNCGLVLYR